MIAEDLLNISEIAMISDKLSLYNMEEYIDDILYHIYHEKYQEVRENKGISDWSIEQVKSWILTLTFFSTYIDKLANTLEKECVDGFCLMNLTEKHWVNEMNLRYAHYYLLQIIFQGWSMKDSTIVANMYHKYINQQNIKPIGLAVGAISDLSFISTEDAMKMIAIDNLCIESGIGSVYGQLVTLGYKEYTSRRHESMPLASPNEKLILKRRKVSNGLKETCLYRLEEENIRKYTNKPYHKYIHFKSIEKSTSFQDVEEYDESLDGTSIGRVSNHKMILLEYEINPLRDMYQIGRSNLCDNDFIIPGEIHVNEEGNLSSTISRIACRIECERLPPFRCYIYAGGYEKIHNNIMEPSRLLVTPNNLQMDGFTTFGLKILQPEVGIWLEVSVRGFMYDPRNHHTLIPTEQVYTAYENQLTDGTIVNVGGISFIFQDPNTMIRTPKINPMKVVEHLNSLKPHCPVLFNEISFTYMDNKQKTLQALRKATINGNLARYPRGIHIPIVDNSNINEENRPYVYPGCGHIFAYHKSIQDRPCPMCRKQGSFVPLAFTFDASICNELPTHVFNPCGHIASLQTCMYWSTLQVYSKDITKMNKLVHICPYCNTELIGDITKNTQTESYHKLGLQTESGEVWPDNILYSTIHEHTSNHSSNNNYIDEQELSNDILVTQLYNMFPSIPLEELKQMLFNQQLLYTREYHHHHDGNDHRLTIQKNTKSTTSLLINNNESKYQSKQRLIKFNHTYPKYIPQCGDKNTLFHCYI